MSCAALILELCRKKSSKDVDSLFDTLNNKWNHLLPIESAFQSEHQYWKRQPCGSISVAYLIGSHADKTFFLNIKQLLQILVVLPIASTEAERSFS